MNKKIFFIHGNPGDKNDWDLLVAKLPADVDLKFVDPYSEDWTLDIQRSAEKVLIVVHSWGCYRLLKNYSLLKNKIERVFLVNPYLIQEKPISNLVLKILKWPILGQWLIRQNHQRSYRLFFDNMIAPYKLSDHSFYSNKLMHLSDWKAWKLALQGKELQQKNPIEEATLALGYAYIGEDDQSVQQQNQLSELARNKYLNIRFVKKAGHGILWSHPDLIAKDILHHLLPIGYNSSKSTSNNVISYMAKHVEEHGEKSALSWVTSAKDNALSKQDISFRQLDDRIAKFAQGLLNIGVVAGDRIIIFLPMSVDMYIAMFAVQRIGAIAVFLDSWARSNHLGASAECVNPKAMISFDRAFKLIAEVAEFSSMPLRILFGPGDIFTHKYQDIFSDQRSHIEPVFSEDTALITFTTGSTGKPKGANRTHRFLSAQHMALTHVIPYSNTDIDMPAFPIFSLNSLATGVTTVLPAINLAQPDPTDPAILTLQILQQKITSTTLSPSMLVGLAKYCLEHKIILSNLRRIVTGGAAISKDDVRLVYGIAPQIELWILYGSTEAEPMAHIEGRKMLEEESALDAEIVEKGVNVGEVSEDIRFKFIKIIQGPIAIDSKISWDDLEVASGEVGEFICTGDHVCREYYNNPEAFQSTKILDEKHQVWHRTGDLAYIDKKNDLWIIGRVNNAIVRKNKYYFPVQAEVILKRFDYVYRCAYLGMPSSQPDYGQEAYAVIQLKHEIQADGFDYATAIKQIQRIFLKNNIPVDQIKFVAQIPMDPRHHSKVEYSILRQQILQQMGVLYA
ncbi:MAG: AMP-binding protein [Pseudobdellovibrionaceae bacterium]